MVPNAGCVAVYALLWNDPGQDRRMTSTVIPLCFLERILFSLTACWRWSIWEKSRANYSLEIWDKVHLILLLPKSLKQGALRLNCLTWGAPWLSNDPETDTWQSMPQNISKVTSQDLPWGWCVQRLHTSDNPGNKSLYMLGLHLYLSTQIPCTAGARRNKNPWVWLPRLIGEQGVRSSDICRHAFAKINTWFRV